MKAVALLLILFQFHLQAKQDSLKIAWLGTTNFVISDGKSAIMFDPFISKMSWFDLVFARNLHSDKMYVSKWLNKVDKNVIKGIFVSHGHFDHVLDLNSSQQLTNAFVYGDKVARKYLTNKKNFILMKNKSQVRIGEFHVTSLEAKHSPHVFNHVFWADPLKKEVIKPAPFYAYKAGQTTFSYLIRYKDKKIYFHPSSTYVKSSLPNDAVDVLILGIANRKSDQYLLDGIVSKLNPQIIVPAHHDSLIKNLEKKPKAFFMMKYDSFRSSLHKAFPKKKILDLEYGVFEKI